MSGTDERLEEAEAALSDGAYAAAQQLFRAILEADPASFAARFGLARAYLYAGRHDEARQHYEVLLARHPDNPDLYVGRGYAYLHERRFPEALADFHRALAQYPPYPDAWQGLIRVHLQQGDPRTALVIATRWTETFPDSPDARSARAHLQERMQRLSFPYTTLQLGFDVQSFAERLSAWQSYTARLSYRRSQTTLYAVRISEIRRFDQWDEAFAAEAYGRVWRHLLANVSLQAAPTSSYLPDLDYRAELSWAAASGWMPSLSYRDMRFDAFNVQSIGLGMARYQGAWLLTSHLFLVFAEEENGRLYAGAVRRYLGTLDTFVEVRGGGGEQAFLLDDRPVFARGTGYFVSARFQTFLTTRQGLTVAISYNLDEALPRHGGFSIAWLSRW